MTVEENNDFCSKIYRILLPFSYQEKGLGDEF